MSSADALANALIGAIGANDETATVSQFLDTGYPPFNTSLSSRWEGGFPVGRIIELAGPPSSGKTAIATKAMASAQQMKGIAMFMDHEHSFDENLGAGLGLDLSPGRWVYKKPRTYEDSLTLVVKVAKLVRSKALIPADAPICVVFDSLASMVPQSALYDKDGNEKELDNRSMHDNTALARATSASMPAFSLHCEELNICAIFLNQIRMKIGVMYGDARTTPGGESPKFYASQRIMLGAARKIQKGKGEEAEVLGVEINATVIKNKVSRPWTKAGWRFMFQLDGSGKFDVVRSLIDFLADEKLITKAGNYLQWTDGKKYYATDLAKKLEAEPTGLDQLKALLPADYTAPVVSEVELAQGEQEPAEETA